MDEWRLSFEDIQLSLIVWNRTPAPPIFLNGTSALAHSDVYDLAWMI